MVEGINKYPNLKRRLEYELGRGNCPACQKRKIISKYKKLVNHRERTSKIRNGIK